MYNEGTSLLCGILHKKVCNDAEKNIAQSPIILSVQPILWTFSSPVTDRNHIGVFKRMQLKEKSMMCAGSGGASFCITSLFQYVHWKKQPRGTLNSIFQGIGRQFPKKNQEDNPLYLMHSCATVHLKSECVCVFREKWNSGIPFLEFLHYCLWHFSPSDSLPILKLSCSKLWRAAFPSPLPFKETILHTDFIYEWERHMNGCPII